MSFHHIQEIEGTEFPAGRRTRVMVGPNAPLEAQHFVMGHVTIYPGGSVPLHDHEQEEVYMIVAGRGVMHLDEEGRRVEPGSYVFIKPGAKHWLENTSGEDMIMVFVYAPKAIVSHWQQERDGEMK